MMCDLRWAFVGIFALGWLAADATQAQQQPSQFAPIAPPTYDPDLLKTPPGALGRDADGFKADRSGKTNPGLAIPNGVDLGRYQLEFNAKATSDVTKPGVAIDSGETSNLSKVAPGQRQEPVLPDYFGLKLRAPTH